MKGRTFVRKVLFAVNIIFAIGLVSSSLAHLVDPNTFLVPSFLGLAFLPFLAINSIAFIFWLFAKFRNSWLSLAAMLLALPSITTHFAFSNAAESSSSDIKVMSYNVRLFDLYNWSSNKKTRNLILDYFTQEDADIICIQEFFNSNDNSYFNTLDTMLKVQNAKNVHDEYTAILHKGRSKFGIATFSKYPIKNRQIVQLDTSGNNIAIFTDIETDLGMLRVFNVHLASVHLSSMEKDINEHIEKSDQSKQWNDVKVMSRKLAGGFKKRANQAKVIRSYIEQSPYPVIICGDFNDTPSSFAYHTIRNDFQDAFLTKGSGLGASYIGFIPSLRIDYVMCDSNFKINQFTQSNVKLSDHKPAIAQISLKAKTN